MKKIIFALFAVAAFAACNNEHTVVTPKGEAIGFANAFVDGTTKAIDPSITTTGDKGIKQFVVYGYTQGKDGNNAYLDPVCIFPGITVNGAVTSVDADGESIENNATAGWWTYDSVYTQYWIEGNTYKFAAVVNGTDAATKASVTPDTTTGLPATIAYDVTTQNDLLYDVTSPITGQKSGNDDVAFTFDHLLSKAVFTFKNTTPEDPDTGNYYTVESIVIKGLGKTANCDVTGTTPDWGDATGEYTAEFGNIVETATPAGATAVRVDEQKTFSSNYERLLIPGEYNLTIECVITMWYDNGVVGATPGKTKVIKYSKELTHEFVQGNAYSFNLTAGLEDQIEFTVVKVNNWIENQKDL